LAIDPNIYTDRNAVGHPLLAPVQIAFDTVTGERIFGRFRGRAFGELGRHFAVAGEVTDAVLAHRTAVVVLGQELAALAASAGLTVVFAGVAG
jgi:hypothetical protein